MVKLVQTDRIHGALQTLVDARGGQRSRLPLELLTAIQDHLDDNDDKGGPDVEKDAAAQRTSWVEHRLLADISRWNRSTEGELSVLRPCCAGVGVCITTAVPDMPIAHFTWYPATLSQCQTLDTVCGSSLGVQRYTCSLLQSNNECV